MHEMWLCMDEGWGVYDAKPVMDICGHPFDLDNTYYKVVYLDDDEYKDYMDVCAKYHAWQDNLKERMRLIAS